MCRRSWRRKSLKFSGQQPGLGGPVEAGKAWKQVRRARTPERASLDAATEGGMTACLERLAEAGGAGEAREGVTGSESPKRRLRM